jgi:hypothetical protein
MYQLAQINIGRFRLPQSDPANAEFMNALDRVNALAEAQPGFVWRLKGDGNSAIDLHAYPDPQIAINMSVWTDLDALAAFVYRTPGHLEIMRRRREWLESMDVYMALWWIRSGHRPAVAEGKAALETLARLGPTQMAFTFKQPFPAPCSAGIDLVVDTRPC